MNDKNGAVGAPSGRIVWLDALRVLSCFGVIAVHIWAPMAGLFRHIPRSDWLIGNAAIVLISWCVPMFVMISGALLLSRPCHEDVRGFFVRRARIFWQTVFWMCFFTVFRFITERAYDMRQVVIGFVYGISYYHMWFLNMIIGLYVFTPVLSWYVRVVQRGVRFAVLGLVMFASIAWSYYAMHYMIGYQQTIMTLFLPFIGYYLLGYELLNVRTERRKAPYFLAVFVVVALFLMLFAYLCARRAMVGFLLPWLYCGLSPFVVIMSVVLFQYFHARWTGYPAGGIMSAVARLSPLTLGIYIVHPFFIRFLEHMGFVDPFSWGSLSRVVIMLIVFAWSALSVWAISKIPYIRGLVTGRR